MASSSWFTVTLKVRVLLLLCAAALASSAVIEKRSNLCEGNSLVDTLMSLCDGVIYDPTQKRRLGRPRLSILPHWVPLMESGSSKLGFLDSKTALQLFRPAGLPGRQPRGIVEECCHKSCSVSELQSYCGLVSPNADD